MNENLWKGFTTAALAAVGLYFHELLVPVILLAFVMVVDYISGMARAWEKGEFSSKTGIRGIIKKLCYMFGVAVAVVADWIIQIAAAQAGVDVGASYLFALLVTIWLALNECISILENIADIGVPVPEFLVKLIGKLKQTTEARGGGLAEGDDHDNG